MDIRRVEVERDFGLTADCAIFDEEVGAIEEAVAVQDRHEKGVTFDNDVAGLVSQEFVRDTSNDAQAASQFNNGVGWPDELAH